VIKSLPLGQLEDFGLGLFIVKSMLKGYQGSIHVSSELGRGVEFAIRVPRHYGEIP
jgi:signal transduction histidine kinase